MEFKNRIKELRKERDLTQQELADKLGISKQAISMYEQGNRQPNFEIADALADFFGVSIGYLSGSSDERGAYPRHGSFEWYRDAIIAPTDALASELQQLVTEYLKASPDTKAAVRAVLGIH